PQATMMVRRLRVTKCRGVAHSTSDVPFTITASGLHAATYPRPDAQIQASDVRISSGIRRLDTMLDGGFFRGSSVLVSGSPGTAKSTLAATFADAAARRGDQTLYVSFDESPDEIVRNMRSVAVDLERHLLSGILSIVGRHREEHSADEHVAWIA